MSYDIVAGGTSQNMILRFRIRDVGTAVPRVEKIWIGKPDEARKRRGVPACLVRGDAVSMKEWHYGETPFGFLKFGCQELGPGEYVVSVRFLGGYGGIGMAIDEKGHVTTLPLERRLPSNQGVEPDRRPRTVAGGLTPRRSADTMSLNMSSRFATMGRGVLVVVGFWMFAAVAAVLSFWVLPRTAIGWVAAVVLGPVFFIASEALAEMVGWLFNRLPSIRHAREVVEVRTKGQAFSGDRVFTHLTYRPRRDDTSHRYENLGP
jgi:hypothetical protein